MSVPQYSEIEVLYFGIWIKEKIKALYHKRAESLVNEDVKDLLHYLHSEHSVHIIWFKQLITSLNKGYEHEAYPEDYFYYLAAIIDPILNEQIFSSLRKDYNSWKDCVETVCKVQGLVSEFFKGLEGHMIHTDKHILHQILEKERDYLEKLSSFRDSPTSLLKG